jgi:hypothetical protein
MVVFWVLALYRLVATFGGPAVSTWPVCCKFPDLKKGEAIFSLRLVQVYQIIQRPVPKARSLHNTFPAGSHGRRI